MGILVDEGKVNWDEPVRTYLPEFRLQDGYASEHATLRDLLSHRTGLPRHDLLWMGGQFNRQELMGRLRYLDMSKELRSAWQYSNLMYTVVGYLVGKVDGSSWEEFTQRRLLDPLGMTGTTLSLASAQATGDFSWPYMQIDDDIERMPFRDTTSVGPSGSIHSNVLDMAQWLLMNLDKGQLSNKRIVSEASMAQLHSPQMIMPGASRYDEVLNASYGMGWMIQPYRGHLLVWHGGGIDGFVTQLTLLPREKAGIVVLTNLNINPVPGIVSYNIVDRLLGLNEIDWDSRIKAGVARGKAAEEKAQAEAEKNRTLDTRPSHPLAEYAGTYEHPAFGDVSVAYEGDSLTLTTPMVKGRLSHRHYDVFDLTDSVMGVKVRGTVAFTTGLKGTIVSLFVSLQPPGEEIVFTRVAEEKK